MIESAKKLPLALQNQARRNFVGHKVVWHLALLSFSEESGGSVRITMEPRDGKMAWVVCKVKLTDYPEVRTAMEKQTLWVRGIISGFSELYAITLSETTLHFD